MNTDITETDSAHTIESKAQNAENTFTCDKLSDLGEVETTPDLTPEQMEKFMKLVNTKINHYRHQEIKLDKRRAKNKQAKKSRKNNRKK